MNSVDNKVMAFFYALFSVIILFLLHIVPFNLILIDPFSEAIKQYDVMDITYSKIRKVDTTLFDSNVIIINSGQTDRIKIAKTLDKLNQLNVKAIGLDILLDTFYKTKIDTILRNAIENSKNLVLGYTFNEGENENQKTKNYSSHDFFSNGVMQGFVNLASNDGYTVRAFEPFHKIGSYKEISFSVQLASLSDDKLIDEMLQRNHKKEWINFKRTMPSNNFSIRQDNVRNFAHYRMIQMDNFISDSIGFNKNDFENKTVLVGFCGENESSLSMKDRYYTPLNPEYAKRSFPDMHGVFIHANIVSMLLTRDLLHDVPELLLYLFCFFLLYFNYLIFKYMLKRFPFMGGVNNRLVQAAEFILLLVLCVALLNFLRLKMGFFMVATAAAISYELFHLFEHKLADKIKAKLYRRSKNGLPSQEREPI